MAAIIHRPCQGSRQLRRRLDPLRVPLATLLLLAVTSAPKAEDAHDSPAKVPSADLKPISQDCFEELENGSGPLLACRVPLRLSQTEQAELEKGSRGYVKNVSCMLSIQIARAVLQAPIEASEHVFESPEQPVTCSITTYKTTFDVTATFAPKVQFKDHKAVDASPGLGNVKGVSRVVSWPVVQFVNRWPSIQKGMLQVVNAYLAHRREPRPPPPQP